MKKEVIPDIKIEVVEVEPKKEKKKRKTKVEVEIPSTSKAEVKIQLNPDDYQFCCAGAASGALAASALAAEAAALKAIEKEKPAHKRTPKKLKQKQEAAAAAANDDSESESYNPTETEENLQKELQSYALDLLEENPSWEKRKIIQNLVIWEFVPVDPSLLPPAQLVNPLLATSTLMKAPPKRKGKKMRKHQSGLDFAKKKTPGKNSRCVSRATTPDVSVPEEIHDITYTLDDLIGETNRWVIDKSAGETILHRASKMGYPDAAAYALDMAKMSPTMKDNAGIPPIHKAAFRGHSEIVDYLLRFGADPNTNVKGTRPLHEALENGNLDSVYHLLCHGSDPLLYDYSGNMPIDLAEDNDEMFYYFSNILSDLHGKKAERWNVSHQSDFIMPQTDDCDPTSDNDSADFVQKFEPDFVKEENTFSENEEVDEKPVFDQLQHFQLQQQQQQQHDNEQMFKTFTNNSTDMYLNFIGNHNNNNNNNNSGTQNNNNNNNGIHNNNNNSNRNRSNNQIIHSANSRLLNCSGMVNLDPTRQQGLPRFEPQETLNLDPTRQQSFLPRFEPEERHSPGSPSNHFGRRQRDLHLNVKLVIILFTSFT